MFHRDIFKNYIVNLDLMTFDDPRQGLNIQSCPKTANLLYVPCKKKQLADLQNECQRIKVITLEIATAIAAAVVATGSSFIVPTWAIAVAAVCECMTDKHAANKACRAAEKSARGATSAAVVVVIVVVEASTAAVAYIGRRSDCDGSVHDLRGLRVALRLAMAQAPGTANTSTNGADDGEYYQNRRRRGRPGACAASVAVLDT